jgi:putative beta-lysine N-acetyltransferase
MADQIEHIGESTVQHGPENDRVYVMHGDATDTELAQRVAELREKHGYSKIFAKIPAALFGSFRELGCQIEAFIPGYFRGEADALLVSAFFDEDRRRPSETETSNLDIVFSSPPRDLVFDPDVRVEVLSSEEAAEIAHVFTQVFETYPFPIHDPAYIRETMESHIVYFGIRDEGRLVGVSSAEKDTKAECVEMTDFAVLPETQGKRYASYLLRAMEDRMREEGLHVAYTIARALSIGMNKTFYHARYRFSGMLVNNTNISGGRESMNVWYKPLRPELT